MLLALALLLGFAVASPLSAQTPTPTPQPTATPTAQPPPPPPPPPPPAGPSGVTFTVDSTGDLGDDTPGDGVCDDGSGSCTFRAAIEEANAEASEDTIEFDIPGAGPHTIQPASALPTLTVPVIIDGYSQPGVSENTNGPGLGSNAVLKIELDGSNVPAGDDGLTITAGDTTVRGLVINRFGAPLETSHGILIVGGESNVIEGNFIGTDITGTVDLGNGFDGVLIVDSPDNIIGGTEPAARNVLSGNGAEGVRIAGIDATENSVQGNFIGTDVSGTADLGQDFSGVAILLGASDNEIGGATAAARNIISGNGAVGVLIFDAGTSGNAVKGNFLGTDVSGVTDLGNALGGVAVVDGAPNNFIGGTSGTTSGGPCTGACNVISGNDDDGVEIADAGSTGNVVEGNFIGTDVDGTAALANTGAGVLITDEASNNTIGGTAAGAGNVISGNGGAGVHLGGAGVTGNLVVGNFIGTDASGTADLGNSFAGVFINGAPGNTIGGTTGTTSGGPCTGACNVISGNDTSGVEIMFPGATGNSVLGNFVGTDAAGAADLGNFHDGVQIEKAPTNTIGGISTGARNVISGNGRDGVLIHSPDAAGNLVHGNFIGTDAAGTLDLGNSSRGVEIISAPNNIVGGAVAGARNVVSGNDTGGVRIVGTEATGNLVQGNFIGTDADGTADIGNTFDGVLIVGSPSNTIGGTAGTTPGGPCTGVCNIISSNDRNGVLIDEGAMGTLVQGNFIGTDATGAADLGNAFVGVLIEDGASDNTVGGTTAAARNVISGNDSQGIAIVSSTSAGNIVQGNFIGTKADGATALGNTKHGVFVGNPTDIGEEPDLGPSSDNTVGGTGSGAGNVIAFNGEDGVYVGSGTGNAVEGNSIFSNTGLGIDLGEDGRTATDSGDSDFGANKLQNFPDLVAAQIDATGSLFIEYSVDSTTAASTYPLRVEFFTADTDDEEGKTFLGNDSYPVDRAQGAKLASLGNAASLGVSAGDLIVATATDSDGNTSEFSGATTVTTTTANIPSLTQWALLVLAGALASLLVWRARQKHVKT